MAKKRGQITPGLGRTLRNIREERGYTREWVAERSGIGLRHLAAIELGEKNPSVDTLYQLIRCLGVSADWVFYPETVKEDESLSQILLLSGMCSVSMRKLVISFIDMIRDYERENR